MEACCSCINRLPNFNLQMCSRAAQQAEESTSKQTMHSYNDCTSAYDHTEAAADDQNLVRPRNGSCSTLSSPQEYLFNNSIS